MKKLGKFLCVIGEIAAVLLVVCLLIQYIDNIYHFIPVFRVIDDKNTTILDLIIKYGLTLVIGLLALGTSMRVSLILVILIALIIAAVVVFMFYGDIAKSYLPEPKDAESAAAMLAALLA